ncbi:MULTISPECIES: type III secretion protein HrpB4 [Xanthomonas translucens group]|uniref:Transcriptional regulator n=1 Tax=Xanthomonas cerealis pv. cerealis TaxID=152263 RepID=A0A514E9J0_9XANT|nr:type III secretion protein HrpB4 [Xanthomonas translucens]QDI02697.1 transcriptional regulator [Xanthomonas translucens pv. cerealis]UKE48081.1 transcriptional regulator [Xanthomonas translucens pv. cerealis]
MSTLAAPASAQRLLRYRTRVQALAGQASPPPLCDQVALRRAWAGAAPLRRQDLVIAALQLDGLSAACFDAADSELALLEPAPLQQLLFARALYARSDALRHCIERAPRQWLAERLGASLWQWLRGCPASPTWVPLLACGNEAHAQAWYLDGWCRLVADGLWPWPGLARLAAASAGLDPGDAALPGDGGSRDFIAQWRLCTQENTRWENAA